MAKKILSLLSLTVLAAAPANAADLGELINSLGNQPYKPTQISESANEALYSQYCTGKAASTETPRPNYNNALVAGAATQLTKAQTGADQRLKDLARAEMLSFVANAKEAASELGKSENPEVTAAATAILQELSQATADGYTTATNQLVTDLAGKTIAGVTKLSQELAPLLKQELRTIDVPTLITHVEELLKRLPNELAAVDYAAIQKLNDALFKSYGPKLKSPQVATIQAALNALQTLYSATSSSKYEVYAATTIESALTMLKDEEQMKDLSNLTYEVSNVTSVIDNYVKKGKLSLPAQGEAPLALLREQYIALQSEGIRKGFNDVTEAIAKVSQPGPQKQEDVEAVQYAAQNVVDTLNQDPTQLTAADLENLGNMAEELAKFSSPQTMAVGQKVLERFKAGKTEQAIGNAENFASGLEEVHSLSKESKDMLSVIRRELGFSESSEVLGSATELEKELGKSKGQLTDSLVNALYDLASRLENEQLPLQASTKLIGQKLSKTNDEVSHITDLQRALKASPEQKTAEHFYFYGAVTKMYGLNSVSTNSIPNGVAKNAHIFLTQLCGEFRDRATMIEAKLKWVNNLFVMPPSKEKKFSIDPRLNVWSQVPANAYRPYLSFSSEIWEARREGQARFIEIGEHKKIDKPVAGLTVCETKYLFSQYVGQGKNFDGLEKFNAGLQVYQSQKLSDGTPYCSDEDKTDYYDFRGDSNFKHYSPESNGMIWYATSLARACENPRKVRAGQTAYTDEDCRNYFTRPFYYRYSAARAGLATWLFRDDEFAKQFASQGQMVAIYPHRQPEMAPFSFSFDHNQATGDLFQMDRLWLGLPGAWLSSDLGINAFAPLKSGAQTLYERIRDAVDRHTDWYHSGFNDRNGVAKEQAYSPFVASSYEMSESDNFTECGTTVQCPNDGLKRWMFVFRVKGDNWYTPERIQKGDAVDFDRMWFDETSFGVSNLANSEKAWDRLGTAMEGELDSILHLMNVDLSSDDEGDEDSAEVSK